jgi:hypothetical protein
MMTTDVAVEKLDLRKNGMILDDKWSITPYESLIGHPDATFFGQLFASEFFNSHRPMHSSTPVRVRKFNQTRNVWLEGWR